jgi:hypothetical protein
MKPTWRYGFCLFHFHDPKPKRNHQIACSRAKTRSRRSQACVKYRGIIICIKRNTDVNTGNQKILHKKMSKKGWFSRRYLQFLQIFIWFAFNLMLGWRAMTVTVHLATRYKGHSLSVQYYEFYLHAILFLLLIQTRPRIANIGISLDVLEFSHFR